LGRILKLHKKKEVENETMVTHGRRWGGHTMILRGVSIITRGGIGECTKGREKLLFYRGCEYPLIGGYCVYQLQGRGATRIQLSSTKGALREDVSGACFIFFRGREQTGFLPNL